MVGVCVRVDSAEAALAPGWAEELAARVMSGTAIDSGAVRPEAASPSVLPSASLPLPLPLESSSVYIHKLLYLSTTAALRPYRWFVQLPLSLVELELAIRDGSAAGESIKNGITREASRMVQATLLYVVDFGLDR